METEEVLKFINQLVTQLRAKGAIDVEQYEQKLKDNAKNINILDDLLFEGKAALLFLNHGFKVTLGDRPDLKMEINDEVVYAEVTHFREKEQDRIDDEAMAEQARKAQEDEEENILVRVGDTRATEGLAVAEQIARKAINKAEAGQYMADAPNILLIESSSESTSLTLSSAAQEYDDMVRKSPDPRLRRLNALMMVNCGYAFGNRGPYNTEYCPLTYANVPMSNKLIYALSNIKLG